MNTVILVGTLAYALFLVARSSTELKVTANEFCGPMKGQAKWDPKESWASNLTAAGTILVTVISAKPVQETLNIPVEYFALSVFFAALGIVAPFFYNAMRKDQSQGYLWSFMIATIMTVWGAAGQLATLGFLVKEIWAPSRLDTKTNKIVDGISTLVFVALEVLIIFTFVMIIPYAKQTIRGLIDQNRGVGEQKARELGFVEVSRSWSIL